MTIKENRLKGVFEIQLEAKDDNRGFFMRTYDSKIFQEYGISRDWVQEYHNFSAKKGTIRGLHLQLPPHTETKLVRAVAGSTLDVFVDLRKDSPTFGKWDSIILSAENKKMVYIPRGFAHGLCSLTDNAMITCKMDNHYAPDSECQIKWNDPDLNIAWQIEGQPIVSEKDSKAGNFKDFIKKHAGGINI